MGNDLQVSAVQTDTTVAIAGVREALGALKTAIGTDLDRPTDLQRRLGVDYKLAWQVYNVICEPDAMAVAKLVPGAPSLQRLLRAAKNKGVPIPIINEVRRAVAAFEQVVNRHAVDRTEFDLMTSSMASPDVAAAAELAYRKSSFRSDSHIWGVCAEVFCSTCAVRLQPGGNLTDELTLTARRGYRRLRPDAPMSVFVNRYYGADGTAPANSPVPLDLKSAEQYGAAILPKYCSQPIPPFRTRKRPDGSNAIDIQSREIGRQHAINLTLGQISRGCPLAKGEADQPYYQTCIRVATPTKLLVQFLLIHRPSFGAVQPELMIYRQTPGDDQIAVAKSAIQLPVRDDVQYLGTGRAVWQIPDVQEHAEMVQSSLDEIGWNPAEFDVFRLRIEYPVLHSAVRTGFPLDKP